MAAVVLAAAAAEDPPENAVVEDVEICALLSNPFVYNRKLIRVTGSVARDFETFWIESSKCPDSTPLWIEYGGPKPADGPAWHDVPEHPSADSPLWIEGIKTSLEADANFRKFDSVTKSLKRGKRARATLIGWVFSGGVYKDESGNEQEIAYGPYGMYSLFVVKKVDSVSRR